MNLSEGLKRFRNEFRFTQKEVAENTHISIRNYQDYEYGRVVPTATILINIANYYGVSIDYLVGRTDNPKTNH